MAPEPFLYQNARTQRGINTRIDTGEKIMSLLKMLMDAQGGQGLGQLAKQFGIDEEQAGGLAGMLAPAIAQGAKRRTQQGGLEAVLGQLKGEAQGAYLDNPAAAAAPEGRAQGEQFLEQIFGSRQASQDLAAEAANRSGVSQDAVSQFLPAIAAMMQGGMQRSVPDSSIQGMIPDGIPRDVVSSDTGGGIMGMIGGLFGGRKAQASGQVLGQEQAGGLGMLTQLLDADGDGSALDDILERVMKR
jgi:hypothetical protein